MYYSYIYIDICISVLVRGIYICIYNIYEIYICIYRRYIFVYYFYTNVYVKENDLRNWLMGLWGWQI